MDNNKVNHPPSDNFNHPFYWCTRIEHLDYDDTFTKFQRIFSLPRICNGMILHPIDKSVAVKTCTGRNGMSPSQTPKNVNHSSSHWTKANLFI